MRESSRTGPIGGCGVGLCDRTQKERDDGKASEGRAHAAASLRAVGARHRQGTFSSRLRRDRGWAYYIVWERGHVGGTGVERSVQATVSVRPVRTLGLTSPPTQSLPHTSHLTAALLG